jgi:hypothetical protein
MPACYRQDSARGVLVVTLRGDVTDQDLLDLARKASRDPEIEPGQHELVDCREVEAISASTQCLRRVAEIYAESDRADDEVQVAIVAPRDAAYGVARMYQAFRTGSPVDIQVFREMEQAEAWLGLAPGGEASPGG